MAAKVFVAATALTVAPGEPHVDHRVTRIEPDEDSDPRTLEGDGRPDRGLEF
jgi:hypothetical protein